MNKPADSQTGRPRTDQRDTCAGQITAQSPRQHAPAGRLRTGCYRSCPCTSGSSTTAPPQPTPGTGPSITSPPGGWPSGWPPGRRHRTSPRAWSASSRPERSARRSRPSCASTPARGNYPDQLAGRPAHATTAPPAAPTSARSARTSAPPATRSTAPTSCWPTSTTGPGTAAAPPSRPGPRPTAPGSSPWPGRNPDSQTVSLILDATTASIAIFAIAAHADEREAHIREVERFGQTLPEGSYGRRNRQAIAARETRIAARLRAVEHAYRMAIERDAVFRPPEPTRACRSPEHAADREIELE